MSSLQPGTTDPPQPRLHRPFLFFDLEALGVVAILLGVFQVLMALPLYFIDQGLPVLYILPLCVGVMFVAAGSFAVACEKTPSKELLKGCAISNLAGLVGALCAFCVYSVCIHSPPTFRPCVRTSYYYHYHDPDETPCPGDLLTMFFRMLSILLLIYDIAALILHSLLTFSALKGLKTN
ncbi:hypothetical protein COCON_G00100980 [Conger conger]|uniref:Uncharacterized protein n=1 Tax=Conger conger TaxID=82655 RepID=A0A9Q1DHY1_CONCO|nr:uncharacterized protein si:dkey-9i23.16 [Conger conger]KAJ8271239.1 hypothetical protein COCON_G00100980 [Conger conger]